ncbi:5780_t:CDS:10 [Paraglomus occultum]|uniref:Protein BZZ1 n=1 Tax=Paraglomus occultum TaxID=144539 RepID=A0A9N8VQM2_9GLOM|nr:5780_t:CDS:10 [Paraglomus occultum]
MSFGTELKDQIPIVNQFVQNGIQFLGEFRDFIKERAAIEKEYASKLEAFAKKYTVRKDRRIIGLSVGDATGSPRDPEYDASTESSTFVKAWAVILQETENMAKDRAEFSENLSTIIFDEIKSLALKQEEARKKHFTFAAKLGSDRDKIYAEKQKAKSNYDEKCAEVLQAQQKLDKAQDEKTLEKLRKEHQQDIIERNISKNLYLLALRVANAQKKKYSLIDLPAILDHMQELNENRVRAVKYIWDEYVDFELSALSNSEQHLEIIKQALEEVDETADSELFIKFNKREWQEPPDFEFEAYHNTDDNEDLQVDDVSQVYLSNKLVRVRKQLASVNATIEIKERDIEGMQSLQEAYSNNANLGDADTVIENLLEYMREVTVLRTMQTNYETEINAIIEAIGDVGSDQIPHEFKTAAFTIPAKCDLCAMNVWGLKQGLACKNCGYNCHAKCEMKVPLNCTKELGNIRRGGLNASMSFVGTTSSYGTVSDDTGPSSAPAIEEQTHRAAVLYNYTARNADELDVSKGDASINGREGLVPASYIDMDVEDSVPASHIVDETETTITAVGDFVRAIYDWVAQSADEISFSENDIIEVINRDAGEGWFEGIINGKRGHFPANYVEDYNT